MIARDLQTEIKRLSESFSIVAITGPRQSGKTTLAKSMFKDYHYFNFEDTALREQVNNSPKEFLIKYATKGVLLDEVQLFPEIFPYIQLVSDEHTDCKFVLTGSSNFMLLEKITESLAGRVAICSLLPLSFSEIRSNLNISTNTIMLNGFYPAVWNGSKNPKDVYRHYYNTYIEKDVRKIINVKDISLFQTFIRLCAGRIAHEFNASNLSNEIGVSVHTIQAWLSALEASYIVFRLPPFYKNIRKQLTKSPKLYFYDTGLVCFLLGIDTPENLDIYHSRGDIFENMVVANFIKNRYNMGKEPNIFFYKDKSKIEVDIFEQTQFKYNAIEIKSSKIFHSDFFANLNYVKNLLNEDIVSMSVIFDGDISIPSQFGGTKNFRSL